MRLYRDEEILADWLVKLYGMDSDQINEEISLLRKCIHLDNYLRISRKRTTFSMTEEDRKVVWDLSIDAVRQETIEKRVDG